MRLGLARPIADGLVKTLLPACDRLAIAGSIRRGAATVKDIEIVCIPSPIPSPTSAPTDLFGNVHPGGLTGLDEQLGRMVASGALKRGGKDGRRFKRFIVPTLDGEIVLDLFIVLPPAQWGVIFTMRTGPADFSHWVVTSMSKGGALPGGMKVAEGQLWRNGEERVETPEEADFFEAIGLAWVEPGRREAKWRR